MNAEEHNPGEQEFGGHDEDSEHNPGEQDFDNPDDSDEDSDEDE